MKKNHILLSLIVLLTGVQSLCAQSIFDFPLFSGETVSREQSKAVKFDYDVDFHYFFDAREFSASNDVYVMSEILNVARLTPTVSLSLSQNKKVTHRIVAGIDILKDLGENPVSSTTYSEDEDREGLVNSYLFKEILAYYNLRATGDNELAEIYAGIFPRSARSGYYSRSMFSDADMLYNPNLEGFLLKYERRKFLAEAGADCLGYKGIDRRFAYMAFTSGAYKPFKWGSIGWDGTFTTVGSSYMVSGSAQSLILNPYLKFEFGHMLGMQDLSIRAGGLLSYQNYKNSVEDERMPMGVEVVSNVKHWNVGIENTAYYGDNMMPYRSSSFIQGSWTSSTAGTLYKGERFYFTRRGYASFYDRLELYYQPKISQCLDLKVSAVSHFVSASENVKPFLGWEAKASLIFNLDALRNPVRHVFGNTNAKKARTTSSPDGHAVRL